MSNPFEDEDGRYLVLVNEANQHSLWPADLPAPDGWVVRYGQDTRGNCLDYVETHWTDLRPASATASVAAD